MKWRHLFFVACVLTAGCYRAVGVTVTELAGGRFLIEASENWNPPRPCLRNVSMRRQDGDQWTDYWSIYLRTDEAQCVGQFTYPLVPPGYERAVTPAPDDLLRSGDVLQVEISGSGFGNATTFTVS